MDNSDLSKLIGWFASNTDKPFVNRMIDAPKFDPDKHQLGWSSANGKNIVYPASRPNGGKSIKGKLKKMSPGKAYATAINNNDFMEFSTPEEAAWFVDNYKKIWD